MDAIEIIRLLGGAPAIANALGFPGDDIGAKRVRAWGQRRSIPAEYWAALTAYASRVGVDVSLDLLAATHAAPDCTAA